MGRHSRPLDILTALLLIVCLGTTHAPALADGTLVSIYDIQLSFAPSGDSPYAGQIVQTAGIVTAVFRAGYVIAEPAGGPWSGIYVYDPERLPDIGDRLQVSGRVAEYYGMTELSNVTEYAVLSTGNDLPLPVIVSCAEAGAEPYEGVWIAAGPVTVTQQALGHGEWVVEDAGGALRMTNEADLWYLPQSGDALSFVQGILFYSFGEYKLAPRNDEDLGTPAPAPFALHGAIASPDEIIADGYVIVRGQRIDAVRTERPVDMPVIDTSGIIYPGLVNAHDHPQYNIFPRLRFDQTFENRYEWQASATYAAFRQRVTALTSAGLSCEMWKYAEVRALMAGNTTQQGAFYSDYWDCYAHPRVLVRNPERINRAIRDEIFPLRLSESSRATLLERVQSGAYRALLIHLSEGTDAASIEEFTTWQTWGLLPASVIIHGIPYDATHFSAMHAAGASLVWSPRSNLQLYGETANPKVAMDEGVLISLAPDWCPTGSYDILRELKVADAWNRSQLEGWISDADLARMVTTNPAAQLDLSEQLGQIAPDYLADLIVIAGDPADPHRTLIEARPQDVRLVLVGGEALYGETSLMQAMPGADAGEPIDVCGETRRIRVALDAASIPGSSQTLSEIIERLRAVEPGILPLDPCQSHRQWLPIVGAASAP
jgi:5-methylthioadenosine/S-adenosylhomocysteine deaminase